MLTPGEKPVRIPGNEQEDAEKPRNENGVAISLGPFLFGGETGYDRSRMLLGRYIMTGHESTSRELAKGAGRLLGHGIAIVVGLVLMFVGTAMGVSLVLLPIGIPVGLAGLAVFLWGLFGWSGENERPKEPPGR
jgi:hypothetical protein